MKILIIDDEEIYFELLKINFNTCEVFYEQNPVVWLDRVELEKANLNEYQFIFCDYYFDNLSMNSFQLKLSKYIREHGFKNYLILFSLLTFFDENEINHNEYFDLILDKANMKALSVIQEKCEDSPLRALWKNRLPKKL